MPVGGLVTADLCHLPWSSPSTVLDGLGRAEYLHFGGISDALHARHASRYPPPRWTATGTARLTSLVILAAVPAAL